MAQRGDSLIAVLLLSGRKFAKILTFLKHLKKISPFIYGFSCWLMKLEVTESPHALPAPRRVFLTQSVVTLLAFDAFKPFLFSAFQLRVRTNET